MSGRHTSNHASHPSAEPLAAIILAAGKGKRMNSDQPKVVHAVADHAMVWWVVQACREAGASPIVLVIGHGAQSVRDVFADDDDDIRYAVQDQQLGTGHATLCAQNALGTFDGDVLVLGGDGPLIRAATIRAIHQRHVETGAAATMATSVIADPTGYGRIVRDSDGRFDAIVEHKNASPAQRTVREIYPSYACFNAALLFETLSHVQTDPVSGEYYLTDVFKLLKERGHRVEIVEAVPPQDILSINTLEQLAEVDGILRARLNAASAIPVRTGKPQAEARR